MREKFYLQDNSAEVITWINLYTLHLKVKYFQAILSMFLRLEKNQY